MVKGDFGSPICHLHVTTALKISPGLNSSIVSVISSCVFFLPSSLGPPQRSDNFPVLLAAQMFMMACK